jgi:hypothetical protein
MADSDMALGSAAAVAEPAARTMKFIDAAGRPLCLWPISGGGAMMIVCGADRGIDDRAYCPRHRAIASHNGTNGKH